MTKKSQIEGGKWENLHIDCLVNILGRVGIESLIVDVPFVCKSWFKATLNPYSWKQLHFPPMDKLIWNHVPFVDRFRDRFGLEEHIRISEFKFIKGIIDRGAGFTTTVDLRFCLDIDKKLINYVADNCPALKNLVLRVEREKFLEALKLVIRKFKNLESLEITSLHQLKDIITEIGSHCVNFASLKLVGFNGPWGKFEPEFHKEDVRALVTSLPKLKFLILKDVSIDRENVIRIIDGCMSLVCLDVRRGFDEDEDDDELSNLASHIPIFLRGVHSLIRKSDNS